MFDAGKTRMIGLPHGEKIDNMLSRFIQYRNITNGRMDKWTELLYQYRDKNLIRFGMSLVRFRSVQQNAVRFRYYCYLLLLLV